ncbi:hypothetical protein JTE90_021467 [Oedothorax gibbosus]|uniref:Uncharacterized protein n=1 Tax=Oedothorax gibbosus TaxID=931172 RepID=A0AAV6VY81_9ARAC|nr:hypothetical protein JTE90_021467 [Oedothorax gibbosus]
MKRSHRAGVGEDFYSQKAAPSPSKACHIQLNGIGCESYHMAPYVALPSLLAADYTRLLSKATALLVGECCGGGKRNSARLPEYTRAPCDLS